MKTTKWVTFLFVACLFLTTSLSSLTTTAAAGRTEITYIANEGFLIERGGKRVLVDALFRTGIKPYLTVPEPTREKLEKAQAPFAQIDLILASHFHADHYDALAVAEHLAHNPQALFVSTNQAVDKLKSESTNFAAIKDRVYGFHPKEGERLKVAHRGVQLQVLNVHHGRNRPIENLGLLWEIASARFLHIGDSQASAADFKSYDLLKDKIDFAFLPYWYFLSDDQKQAVREYIKPRYIVLMHIPDRAVKDAYMDKLGGWQTWFAKVKAEFPNAVIFERQMEKKGFD